MSGLLVVILVIGVLLVLSGLERIPFRMAAVRA
ncbi:MAG: hypothetical protein KatS3mg053_0683 [Candidatus Roseilinea sp.]|nr:MAG: hypothetical protein KatS3mg053_0683 [Candidatus Roseilinea sp.]